VCYSNLPIITSDVNSMDTAKYLGFISGAQTIFCTVRSCLEKEIK
jgi:hypothetical protein